MNFFDIIKIISIYEGIFYIYIFFKTLQVSQYKVTKEYLDSLKSVQLELPSVTKRNFYYFCIMVLTFFINITTWKNNWYIPIYLCLPPITFIVTKADVFVIFYLETKDKIYYHLEYLFCIIISKFINVTIKSIANIDKEVYPFEVAQAFAKCNSIEVKRVVIKILKAIIYDYFNYLFYFITKKRISNSVIMGYKIEIINFIKDRQYDKLLSGSTINKVILLYKCAGNKTFYQNMQELVSKIQTYQILFYVYCSVANIINHYWNNGFLACLSCYCCLVYRENNMITDQNKLIIGYKIFTYLKNAGKDITFIRIIYEPKLVKFFLLNFFKSIPKTLILDFVFFYLFNYLWNVFVPQIILYLLVSYLPIDYTNYNYIYNCIKEWFKTNWKTLFILYLSHSLMSFFNPLHILCITIEYYVYLSWKKWKVNYIFISKETTVIEERYFSKSFISKSLIESKLTDDDENDDEH